MANHQATRDMDTASALEPRISGLEQQIKRSEATVRAMQVQVLEGIQAANAASEAASKQQEQHRQPSPTDLTHAEGAVATAVERAMASVERQLCAQVQDLASALASLRVKVNGQGQRVGSLAERIESAHERSLEAARAEIAQARQQDQRRWERELAEFQGRLGDANENGGEISRTVREALWQAQADLGEKLRQLNDRVDVEVAELRELLLGADVRPSSSSEGPRHSADAGVDHEQIRAAIDRLTSAGEHMWRVIGDIDAKVEAALPALGRPSGTDALQQTLTPEEAAERQEAHDALLHGTSAIPCESEEEDEEDDGNHRHHHHHPNGPMELARDCEESWSTCMMIDNERSEGRMLQQEFGILAERLQAVDGLAERLARLEQAYLATQPAPVPLQGCGSVAGELQEFSQGRQGAAGSSDDERLVAGSVPGSASPAQLRSLATEVSELQARLLASQFSLHTGHDPNGFQGNGDGEDTGLGHAVEGGTPREEEIVALEERIAEAEQELLGACRPSTSPSSHRSSMAEANPYGAEAAGQGRRAYSSAASLSIFAQQLALLEDVFREFAGQMSEAAHKAAHELPPGEAPCVDGLMLQAIGNEVPMMQADGFQEMPSSVFRASPLGARQQQPYG